MQKRRTFLKNLRMSTTCDFYFINQFYQMSKISNFKPLQNPRGLSSNKMQFVHDLDLNRHISVLSFSLKKWSLEMTFLSGIFLIVEITRAYNIEKVKSWAKMCLKKPWTTPCFFFGRVVTQGMSLVRDKKIPCKAASSRAGIFLLYIRSRATPKRPPWVGHDLTESREF